MLVAALGALAIDLLAAGTSVGSSPAYTLARSILGGSASLPLNHSSEDIAAFEPTTGGKMSSWNTSARRGTMKEMGSM